MKKYPLGKSSIFISPLTLGAMSIGTDVENARKIIDAALDAGINHIDTADLYDYGKNEEIIGKILQERRNEFVITTKVGNRFYPNQTGWYWDPSKKYIMEAVKASLKRLNTDYIDFYMLHGGTIEDPMDETISAFEDLKKEGVIRAYGLSSIRPNVIRYYAEHSSIDGVMLQYNILDRRAEEELLDLLHERNISVIARGPLAKGLLSNHYQKYLETKAKEGYLDYSYEELKQVLRQMKDIYPSSLNELAIKYVLQHPAVTTAVFGASSPIQVEENVKLSIDSPLPKDVYEQVKRITKANIYKAHRN